MDVAKTGMEALSKPLPTQTPPLVQKPAVPPDQTTVPLSSTVTVSQSSMSASQCAMTSSQSPVTSTPSPNPVMSALKTAMVMGPSAKSENKQEQISNSAGTRGANPTAPITSVASGPPPSLPGGIKVIHAPSPIPAFPSSTASPPSGTFPQTSQGSGNVVAGSVTISSRTVTVTTTTPEIKHGTSGTSNNTPGVGTVTTASITKMDTKADTKLIDIDSKKLEGKLTDPAAEISALLKGVDAIRQDTIDANTAPVSENYLNKSQTAVSANAVKKPATVPSTGSNIAKDSASPPKKADKDANLDGAGPGGRSEDKSAGISAIRASTNLGNGRVGEAGVTTKSRSSKDEKNGGTSSSAHEFRVESRATPKPQKNSNFGVNGNSRLSSVSQPSSRDHLDPATKTRSQSATNSAAEVTRRKKLSNVTSKVDSGLRSASNPSSASSRPKQNSQTLPKRASSATRTSVYKTRAFGRSFEMGDAGNGSGEKATLKDQFTAFSRFGDATSDGKQISLTNSDKWMKQAQVIDGKKITTTDTSILFKKLFKTAKKVGFEDFKKYVEELATSKKLEAKDILEKMTNCGPPSTSHATKAAHVSVVDRLTDTSKYTGSHKERFDSAGRGRGLEGRRDVKDSSGYTAAFKTKLAAEKNGTPVAPPSPAK